MQFIRNRYYILLLAPLIVLAVLCQFKSISTFTESNLSNNNTVINHKKMLSNLDTVNETFSHFSSEDIDVADITINFASIPLKFSSPIFIEANRYYIPLSELVEDLGGKLFVNGNNLRVNINNVRTVIDLSNNSFIRNGTSFALKKKFILFNDCIYASLFDSSRILGLSIHWDNSSNTITLNPQKKDITEDKTKSELFHKPALIRLEDIAPGNIYSSPEALEKLRIIADYLYTNNVPFHVAWVPRYIDPEQHIDNSLADNTSMYNADFIYTLDYFTFRKGLIGLHGYTHQNGNEKSVIGTEFSETANATDEAARGRILKAISAAEKLSIPVDFFESPHYSATNRQLDIAEQYFDILYQPKLPKITKTISERDLGGRIIKYIPTPLGYVKGKDGAEDTLNKLEHIPSGTLASFYFHPFLEFDSISITKDEDGLEIYNYSQNSPLHKLIQGFHKNKYKFEKITELKSTNNNVHYASFK